MTRKNIDNVIDRIKNRSHQRLDVKSIQKRIRFLQKSLVQISFGSYTDRPALHESLVKSLRAAQKQMIEFKQQNLQSKIENLKVNHEKNS